MTNVCILLAVAFAGTRPLYQMNVKNAFLYETLKEIVYGASFKLSLANNHLVCKLHKFLYGLKQAPHVWFENFCSTIHSAGFQQSSTHHSLFTHPRPTSIFFFFLLYMDHMVITGSDTHGIVELKDFLHLSFHIKDLGHVNPKIS